MRHHPPHTATSPAVRSTTPTRRRVRARGRLLAAGAATALLLVACGEGAEDAQPTDDGDVDATEETDELGAADEGVDGLDGLDEDPLAGLEDPNERVADGVLAANGLIVPAPEDWSFDQMAFAQGISVASAPEGLEQLAAQVLLPEALPEGVDFGQILDDARDSVEEEPVVDQEIDVDGAVRAVELRYLDLPFEQGDIDTTISEVSIIAEREDGALGLFNYTADSADFDDGVAEQLLDVAAFDPDSEPVAPAPTQP